MAARGSKSVAVMMTSVAYALPRVFDGLTKKRKHKNNRIYFFNPMIIETDAPNVHCTNPLRGREACR